HPQLALPSLEGGTSSDFASAFERTLHALREILHRNGRVSSRLEALDEVAKLIFAHIVDVESGGAGISPDLVAGAPSPAAALRQFVAEMYRLHLPTSLSHELSPADFELRLKDSEGRLATELVDCFSHLSDEVVRQQIRQSDGNDLLNGVFGKFL